LVIWSLIGSLSATATAGGVRLWRLRKDHRSIEAIVHKQTGSRGVHLRIQYNGEATDDRWWPTDELAAEEADARLRDFLRQGWSTHW
jgi:hypothetical protein